MSESKSEILQEDLEKSAWPEFPWLTILIQPRKTIRAIVDSDEDRYVILLVVLAGLASGIERAINRSLGDLTAWAFVLLIVLLLGPIAALVGWAIGGELFRWTGGWFKGEATSREVRTALAWSTVPHSASLFFWLVLLLFYGAELFYSGDTPKIDQNPVPLLLGTVLVFACNLWWYFLLWKCYAEVQRLSLIKSFAALVIPGAVVFAFSAGCGALMVLVD